MSRLNNPRYARPRPLTDQDWALQALCRGRDPQWDSDAALSDKRAAMRVCQTCPVLNECTVAGRDEPFGIWGGVDKNNPGLKPDPPVRKKREPKVKRAPAKVRRPRERKVRAPGLRADAILPLVTEGMTLDGVAKALGYHEATIRKTLTNAGEEAALDALYAAAGKRRRPERREKAAAA